MKKKKKERKKESFENWLKRKKRGMAKDSQPVSQLQLVSMGFSASGIHLHSGISLK